MIAGLDKYYQIARCFRDEDLRADRQPEFSQLDVEMSFATPDQVYALVEGLFARIFRLIDVELPTAVSATHLCGSRCAASAQTNLTCAFKGWSCKTFRRLLPKRFSRPMHRFCRPVEKSKESSSAAVRRCRAKPSMNCRSSRNGMARARLAWIKLGDELSSSLLKALGNDKVVDLAGVAGAQKGDAVLIVAGKPDVVAASLGALRNEIAKRENLIPEGVYAPLWVTEFPMFEYHEDDDRYYAMHHPFTSPLDEDVPTLERAVERNEGTVRTTSREGLRRSHQRSGGGRRLD